MALTRELNELACRYAKYAEFARSVAMRDLERSVCGCDYGSTSWTTRREAERIAQLLELRPASKLLDIGAGSQSMRTELEGMQARARALTEVIGLDEFTERMKRRQSHNRGRRRWILAARIICHPGRPMKPPRQVE